MYIDSSELGPLAFIFKEVVNKPMNEDGRSSAIYIFLIHVVDCPMSQVN
jgi:hypothetical protein